jgi:hypothetical protein
LAVVGLVALALGVVLAGISLTAHAAARAKATVSAVQTLNQVKFHGAALAPYYRLKPKNKGGKAIFILSREARGANKGTYDFFGGKRDPNESHPAITAGREGAEESVYLLGRPPRVQSYIAGSSTHDVIVSKGYVTFITKFSPAAVNRLFRNFKSALSKAKSSHLTEKDSLATIPWGVLQKAVARGQSTVRASVLDSRGRPHLRMITLRPILGGVLGSFFRGTGCRNGTPAKVHFCQ